MKKVDIWYRRGKTDTDWGFNDFMKSERRQTWMGSAEKNQYVSMYLVNTSQLLASQLKNEQTDEKHEWCQ